MDPPSTTATGENIGQYDFPCTCQQYVGTIPAERMLANFTVQILPPVEKQQGTR